MRWLASIAVAFAVLAGAPVLAVQPDEILDDPALEARARAISKNLRCLVCRNENIDDSNAALARDLRLLVRERLVAGDTDEEAVDFIVARYGEYVLLRPRFSATNLMLWLAGPLLLLGGIGAVAASRRRRAGADTVEPLSPEEQARLDALMRDP